MSFDQILGAGVGHLLAGARRVARVSAGVRPGEHVVIVTDVERPPDVAAALSVAVTEAGGFPLIITMPTLRSGDEPTGPVVVALAAADVILAPTTGALYHSAAVRDAALAGARFVGLTGFSPDVLLSGGVFADFPSLVGDAYRLTDLLTQATTARVTAPGGTDLTVNLAERGAVPITGMVRERGERTACPDVESFIAPLETSANGVVVVDASASMVGVLGDPIRITVKHGCAVEIEGGEAARQIRHALEAAATPNAYTLAEFAFGLNPEGVIRGVIVEDEGVAGTGHIALGSNSFFGGTSVAPIHLDFVYHSPTLWLDDVIVIQDGEFLGR
jgi:leucyl aminopeptidase (aminopeptidase T)